jgi:uncharacterized protein YndB with AHSA1/START domain
MDAAAFGTLEHVGDLSILRYERRVAHPQQRVWRAITEDAELATWFPTTIEGPRRAGRALHFSFREGEGQSFDGEMLAFVPPSLMELRWADDVLRFELEPDGERATILRLRVTFPEHGKAARDAAGWHVCLDQLVAACGGTTPRQDSTARWGAVHPAYVDRFGPAASALGPPSPEGED